MKNEPLVTVLIPCFNASFFLEEAIKSIQNQTYSKIEILCINDGSTDNTWEILKNLQVNDDRIKIHNNETNLKLIETLNRGIDIASGDFIARMDADDVSLPERIATQVDFMLNNPDKDVIGIDSWTISNDGVVLGPNSDYISSSSNVSRFIAMFNSPLCHPAIMVRTKVLKEFKFKNTPDTVHVEDYDLWCRLLNEGYGFYSLKDKLFYYRLNKKGVSRSNRASQAENHIKISESMIKRILGLEVNKEVLAIIDRFAVPDSLDLLEETIKCFYEFKAVYIKKSGTLSSQELLEIETWFEQRLIFILSKAISKGNNEVKLAAFKKIPGLSKVLSRKVTYYNILTRIRGIIFN